jgi:hypothetical protein
MGIPTQIKKKQIAPNLKYYSKLKNEKCSSKE